MCLCLSRAFASETGTLTPAAPLIAMLEQGDGWTPLFDGRSLQGWEGDLDGYAAKDGVMVCTATGGTLYTTRAFSDFALAFRFKLSPGANNGVGIRTPREGDPAFVGMELQILDDDAPVHANLHPWQYHGSIYGVVPALRGHLNPAGEWNTEYVICIGPHVRVILNGTTIVDADLRDAEPVDGKAHPGLERQDGHLALCGHGAEVEFKELRVREFAADAAYHLEGD